MILETRNLTKQFGGLIAVNNCSIHIQEGKITSLIGPNGAGKTTLFNLISGTIKHDKGSILFNKENIVKLPIYKRARKGISRTFQLARNFKNLSIRDNLRLVDPVSDSKINEMLKKLGLNKPLDTLAEDLSYGQQRLLEIARALMLPHSLLMLDEPTAGVNPKIRQDFKKLLKNLKKEGKTVILIEHDMDFVMDVSDHVIVLSEGSVLTEGKPSAVRNNKKVLEAYLGK